MRHGKKFNHLGRKAPHRKAMLANMASSLIENKRITTTVAKAKALRGFIEPLITKSKTDSTHSRRVVFQNLGDKDAVSELFREIAPKIIDRNGGYTRIIKTGSRQGDAAEMCLIELVDFNEIYTSGKDDKKSKTRRSRRGGAGTSKAKDAVETTDTKASSSKADQNVENIATAENVEVVSKDDVKVEEDKVEEVKAEVVAEVDAQTVEAAVETEAPVAETKTPEVEAKITEEDNQPPVAESEASEDVSDEEGNEENSDSEDGNKGTE